MTHLHWWLRFAGEWSLIVALMAAATTLGPWSWLPVAWLVGTRQHALAVIGHMGSHRLCGPGSELLAWLCFAPMGGDMRRYRSAHLAHHRAIGVPGIDPEVAVATQFRARWERKRRRDPVARPVRTSRRRDGPHHARCRLACFHCRACRLDAGAVGAVRASPGRGLGRWAAHRAHGRTAVPRAHRARPPESARPDVHDAAPAAVAPRAVPAARHLDACRASRGVGR